MTVSGIFYFYGEIFHVIALNRVLKAGFNDNLIDVMIMAVQADLARQESEKKSQRIGSAWNAKKRRVIANGEFYTNRLPAWLEVRDGKIVEVQEAKGSGKGQKVPADVVREIYRLSAQGIGSHNICRKLQHLKLSRSWVKDVLINRAVLGEFKMVASGEVVPGYFPQVVSQSDFDASRQAIGMKRKNGKYIGGNRQRSDKADNLFSGIVFDIPLYPEPKDIQPMHFQKLSTGYSYLSTAFDKGRKQNRIRYSVIEELVLQYFEREDWKSVAGSSETEEVKAARSDLEAVLRSIDLLSQQVQKWNAALVTEDDVATIKVLAGKVAKAEAALTAQYAQQDALQATIDSAVSRCSALYDPQALIDLIQQQTPEANEIRLRLRSEIRKRVYRIGIIFYPHGNIGIAINYTNGVWRFAATDKDYKFVLLSSNGPKS
jgi:hypothetical protein